MTTAYLLTGSNLGNSLTLLQQAQEEIAKRVGPPVAVSSVYVTAPWGITDQPSFLNQALQVETSLSPQELIHNLLDIEISLGRVRTEKYGPRTIDIDILLYGNSILNEPNLQVPHPQLPHRRFALLPLAELAPDLIHPVTGKTIRQLLEECPDQGLVQQLK